MSTATTLLPTAVALSAESAIDSVLSDIPLFCEGIMGIGIFTFLFITKQVKLLKIFLYGSSFLAFAAATLDLGQVIIRGPRNSSKVTISLASISGFIYAREVFLALSILSLDLFFWHLVSRRPSGEITDRPNGISTNRASRLPSMHSASWNRWGIVGTVLKYGSLAALLSVPLLSMLWRLMPGQRKYGTIYVAEAIVQTSIMAVFILKLFLNVSISPLDKSWHALRPNIVPIASLMIGLALGINNIVIFAFTDTVLGRFLRAVEVYLLIVHSLFTTFQDSQDSQVRASVQNFQPSRETPAEKTNYIDILPLAYSGRGEPSPSSMYPMRPSRQSVVSPRQSLLSWILPPRRAPTLSEPQKHEVETVSTSKEAMSMTSRSDVPDDFLNMSSPKASVQKSMENNERPVTTMSLSYYAMDYGPSATEQPNPSQSLNPARNSSIALFGDEQRGITYLNSRPSSLDEILRQQNELDKSIAALRLVSMSIPNDSPFDIPASSIAPSATPSKSPVVNQSRSTLVSSKTESLSNRSDFSLSVFPFPPTIASSENTTGHLLDAENQGNKPRTDAGEIEIERPTSLTISTAVPQPPAEPQIDSPAVQYDVTSFIGDSLSEPRSSQIVMGSEDFDTSDSTEDIPIISTAQVSPASGLRPMILASMVLAAPSARINPIKYNFEERTSSYSVSEAVPLRPLLLGNPSAQAISQRVPLSKIPLAQRRQRGGTISSSTRRPVISGPTLTQDRNDGVPGAFERPRPPPLRLDDES